MDNIAAAKLDEPRSFSVGKLRGGVVDRDSRRIVGASVITRGEALGHGMWVDDVALLQVLSAGEQRAHDGVPMRWTHPGICNDGMGTQVGRAVNFRLAPDGESVLCDVHFYKKVSRRRSEYIEEIMNLAEEDPEVLGLSIVFDMDVDAVENFMKEHEGEDGKFKSPDRDNDANLPHVRLAKLYWIDFVNEPAANPRGLFARDNITVHDVFDAVLFAPDSSEIGRRVLAALGIKLSRLRAELSSYLESRKLKIVSDSSCFAAISYDSAHPEGTPLAPKDTPWDGPGEVAKASGPEELKIMCAWVDSENKDNKTAYKFPHHKAGGQHAAVWRGVANAAARLPQANIPQSDVPGVQRHLARHYREFGEEPPWSRAPENWRNYCRALGEYQYEPDNHELQELLLAHGLDVEASAILEKNNDDVLEKFLSMLDDSIRNFLVSIGKMEG